MSAWLIAPAVFFCFLVAASSFSSLVTWPFRRADSALSSFMCVSLSAAASCACCSSSYSASIGTQEQLISNKDVAGDPGHLGGPPNDQRCHCSPGDLWVSSKEVPSTDLSSMKSLLAAHICSKQSGWLTLRQRQAQANQEAACLRREAGIVGRGKAALSLLDLGFCTWGSDVSQPDIMSHAVGGEDCYTTAQCLKSVQGLNCWAQLGCLVVEHCLAVVP